MHLHVFTFIRMQNLPTKLIQIIWGVPDHPSRVTWRCAYFPQILLKRTMRLLLMKSVIWVVNTRVVLLKLRTSAPLVWNMLRGVAIVTRHERHS